MKKSIHFLSILIVVTLLFSACKKDTIDPNSIVGKWEINSQSVVSNGILAFNYDYKKGDSFIYQYNSDKTYSVKYKDSVYEKGTYTVTNDSLYTINEIRYPNLSTGALNYVISGNTLIQSDSGTDANGSYTQTFVFSRF